MAVVALVGGVAGPEVQVDEDLLGDRDPVDGHPEATAPPVRAEHQDAAADQAAVDGAVPHPAAGLEHPDAVRSGGGLPGEPSDVAVDRLRGHRRQPELPDAVASLAA